jgi:hypothetical protein
MHKEETLKKVSAKREYEGTDPNGNPFNGLWVVRDADGGFIEFTQWSNDIRDRYSERKGFDLTWPDEKTAGDVNDRH